MKILRYIFVFLIILGSAKWASGGVIPEMEECMRSHTTPKEYEAVIKKHADPGISDRPWVYWSLRNRMF
ncbi:MAG: hypothetical protein WB792_10855 [Desulfobacterales bacterium]